MAGFFDTLFSGGAEREAADKNRALYGDYQSKGSGYLQTGYDTSRGDLTSALGAWSPLSALATKYGQGTDMYMNALGLNGPKGNAAATGAFQTNPGYELSQNAGLDAINRRRGIGGMYNSGNADQDALLFGQNNLYQTQYAPWLQGLSGLNSQNLQATTGAAQGQAATYGSLSDLAKGYASDQTNLLGGTTAGLSSANNLQAQGEASGAKNVLGAGLSLASLALGGAGGGLLSGMGTSLAGMGSNLMGSFTGANNAGMPGSPYFGPVR